MDVAWEVLSTKVLVFSAVETLVLDAEALEVTVPALSPAAPKTSASLASGTKRFLVKMHPTVSSRSSQLLPFPVASLRSPGAKVPAFNASRGSPPTACICFANSRVMALLTWAALGEAGS